MRRAEEQFARQLRKIARHVGDIVRGFDPNDPEFAAKVNEAMAGYAEVIEPWAKRTSERMLLDVTARDAKAWASHSTDMSAALKIELETAPIGPMLQAIQDEQVALIKSLPLEAGERVSKLTLEALFDSSRASEIAKEIARSGDVSISRANVIARTQVSTVASGLVQVRAEHVGSTGYVWRTSRDGDVRPSHRTMQGEFVRWDSPPTLDNLTGHAGALPNCRCYPEPVVPENL